MDITTINKILCLTFPEDVIREISSYFIKKIPKKDERFDHLDFFLHTRKYYQNEQFYDDGLFMRHVFQSRKNLIYQFSIMPKMFIEYTVGNVKTKVKNNIRFWFEDGRCEEYDIINNYWIKI
jgi:hypothetical protein